MISKFDFYNTMYRGTLVHIMGNSMHRKYRYNMTKDRLEYWSYGGGEFRPSEECLSSLYDKFISAYGITVRYESMSVRYV